jgi:hypothetical protein
MPCVGFDPTIPAFERTKTVHALDRPATMTGCYIILFSFLVAPTFGSLLLLLEHRVEFGQILDQGQSVGLLGRVTRS